MKKISLIILVSLILTGCRKVSINREFSKLRCKTKELTNFDIYQNNIKASCNEEINEKLINGITRDQAIDIALINNAVLRSSFEGLGIAKSDLSQAGLYTNPRAAAEIYPILKAPVGIGKGPAVETSLSFAISDLWQVPLKKFVKEDELEIVSLSILELILDIIAQTRRSYDSALYLQEQIKINENILDQTKKLRDDIYKRYEFGLSNDLDKDFSDISVNKVSTEIIKLKKELNQAFIKLKKIMGTHPTCNLIRLNQEFDNYNYDLPNIETLEQLALNHRPELHRARMKIKQYQDELNLEKAKIFKDVNLGVAYKREFGNQGQGVGPYINLELPFFDFNQAQISKREYLLNQATREFDAEKINVLQEVNFYYEELMALIEQAKIYKESLLPKNQKALSYTDEYEKVMQFTTILLIQTRTTLFENKKQLTNIYYDILNAFTNLERSVGKKLEPKRGIVIYES